MAWLGLAWVTGSLQRHRPAPASRLEELRAREGVPLPAGLKAFLEITDGLGVTGDGGEPLEIYGAEDP